MTDKHEKCTFVLFVLTAIMCCLSFWQLHASNTLVEKANDGLYLGRVSLSGKDVNYYTQDPPALPFEQTIGNTVSSRAENERRVKYYRMRNLLIIGRDPGPGMVLPPSPEDPSWTRVTHTPDNFPEGWQSR